MSLWMIAWRSVQKRGLASILTTLSMSLGVMMVVAVLSIYGVVSEQFRNNASLGYNMIVGAKGGKLQLTLNSVYYLSEPIENIDYQYYLEFFEREERDRQLKNSFAYQSQQAEWDTVASQALLGHASLAPGLPALGAAVAADAMEQAAPDELGLGRDGKFGPFCRFVIPLCLGDYFGRFRVVGTTPDMFSELSFGEKLKFEFAQGRNFEVFNEENGYFEAVVGAKVAREMNVQLGDKINPAHGDPEGHSHERPFTVVGILAPSGTPNDRAVFVNMEGFYLMADHAKPLETPDDQEESWAGPFEAPPAPDGETSDQPDSASAAVDDHAHEEEDLLALTPLPLEQREVTAGLIRTVNIRVAMSFQNLINEGDAAQSVQPVKEIFDLLDLIVRPVQMLLLGLTIMICLVSGVSILVSIYNSMSERRHEIAVMRALGANRNTVMTVILLESVFLSLGGGVLGWVFGHSLIAALSPVIEDRTGVSLGFFSMAPEVKVFELLGVTSDPFGAGIPMMTLVPCILGGGLMLAMGLMLALHVFPRDWRLGLGILLFPPAVVWYGPKQQPTVFSWWLVGLFLILLGVVSFVLGADDAVSSELLLVPGLMLLAVVVGFFPAISAYRTDVAQSLGK